MTRYGTWVATIFLYLWQTLQTNYLFCLGHNCKIYLPVAALFFLAFDSCIVLSLVLPVHKKLWVRCPTEVRYSMMDDVSDTMSLLNFHHCILDLTSDLVSQLGEGPKDELVLCAWPLGRKLTRMITDMMYGTVSSLCLISFQPFTPSDSCRASVFPMATISPSLIDC